MTRTKRNEGPPSYFPSSSHCNRIHDIVYFYASISTYLDLDTSLSYPILDAYPSSLPGTPLPFPSQGRWSVRGPGTGSYMLESRKGLGRRQEQGIEDKKEGGGGDGE